MANANSFSSGNGLTNSPKNKPNFNRSISATDLVLVSNKEDSLEIRFFLDQLHKAKNKNNLQGQFFTLSLLEYICNVLNPKDAVRASEKFKGKYLLLCFFLFLLVCLKFSVPCKNKVRRVGVLFVIFYLYFLYNSSETT